MSTLNPFGLLVDDDAEDPTQLLAAQKAAALASAPAPAQSKKAPGQAQPQTKPSAKLPSEAARESRNEGQRGGRGAGRGPSRGRGGRGFNRDLSDNENLSFGNSNGFSGGYERPSADSDKAPLERRSFNGPRGGGGFHGGRRAGFNTGEATEGGERPRRVFERRSGTGRGNDIKREGGGRANWGTTADDIAPATEESVIEGEKNDEKPQVQDEADANKEASANEPEEKEKEEEPEEKEMTLEEYEKVREEKRKALLALKSEERKVNLDKELEAMQLLSNKKNNDEFFAKLGSDKEKKKEAAEKIKKSVSINEFLKPAEGENFYRSGGRGRGGRGRSSSSSSRGGNNNYNVQAPAIEDAGQFPSLGGGK